MNTSGNGAFITPAAASEKALLGCMMLDADCCRRALEYMRPKFFASERNRKIFKLLGRVYEENKTADLVLLVDAAKKAGVLESLGAEAYLADLPSAGVIPAHWRHYADQIQRAFWRGEQRLAAARFKEDGDADKLVRCVGEAESELRRICGSDVKTLQDQVIEFLNELESPRDLIETGYAGIDRGSAPVRSDVFVVAARPQAGKSLLVLNMMRTFLKNGLKVLVCTTEMTAAQFIRRQMALEMGISYNAMKYKALTQDKHRQLAAFAAKFAFDHKDLLFYCDLPSPSAADIRLEMERCKPDIVVIDNLKGVTLPAGRNENKTDRIELFLKEFKAMLLQYNALGLLVCHLRRERDGAKNKEPELSDIKDSSSVEEMASQVLMLWEEDDSLSDRKKLKWKLAKDRDGIGAEGDFLLNRTNLEIVEVWPEGRPQQPKAPAKPKQGKLPM